MLDPHPGTLLGPYEILGLIGAGGMGEVYRARDTKLDRDVALKILPEAFANDPQRLARFEREAKTLAALNHTHVAHIHGHEESDGLRALVLEFVDGPTLADRIARGPVPMNEALTIARVRAAFGSVLVLLLAASSFAQAPAGRETSAASVASYTLTSRCPLIRKWSSARSPNGLRYYVRANARPAHRAELRL